MLNAPNADSLRTVLDSLRLALQLPMTTRRGVASLGAPPDLARTLRSLTDTLRRHDLAAKRALANRRGGLVDERLSKLADVVRDLSEAERRRLRASLSVEMRQVLVSALEFPAPNVLAILNRDQHENSHSDVLRWFLDPHSAPGIAPALLEALLDRLEHPALAELARDACRRGNISVQREVVTGHFTRSVDERDRVDLVISGPGFVIGIENKVYAAEHRGQTESYARWLATFSCLTGGLFLTPLGTEAQSPTFKSISYLDVVRGLLHESAHLVPEEQVMRSSYLRALAGAVLCREFAVLLEEEK